MITRVAVVVPARDEQDEIAGCLRSVLAAVAALGAATSGLVTAEVVVVLDDCHDATADVVAGFASVRTLDSRRRSVGAARAAGAALVLSEAGRVGTAPESLWLAGTDADCRVPRDWLIRTVAHADAGADLVLGTVRPGAGLPAAVMRAWLAVHDGSDGHRHVHGANLGIRGSSYLALGGWSPLPSHEDHELVARAEAGRRLVIRRPGDMTVTTSSRRLGRAPHGFAGYLADLERATGEAG